MRKFGLQFALLLAIVAVSAMPVAVSANNVTTDGDKNLAGQQNGLSYNHDATSALFLQTGTNAAAIVNQGGGPLVVGDNFAGAIVEHVGTASMVKAEKVPHVTTLTGTTQSADVFAGKQTVDSRGAPRTMLSCNLHKNNSVIAG